MNSRLLPIKRVAAVLLVLLAVVAVARSDTLHHALIDVLSVAETWMRQYPRSGVLLFLLLAALFRSVKDSMYVILTIPLASFGGVLALVVLRLFTPQTLDLLTMVGFVVLMGLVVNNAILLVDQARTEMRAGATVRAAVEASLATRTRPIMLTTLTTLFGMLPLVLVPGPGSVLYRGLGAVLVGGMAVNSVFTLVLLPTLLRLIEKPAVKIVAEPDQQPMEAV